MGCPGDPYLEPFWPGAAQKGLDLKPVRLDSPSGLAQGLLRRGLWEGLNRPIPRAQMAKCTLVNMGAYRRFSPYFPCPSQPIWGLWRAYLGAPFGAPSGQGLLRRASI